MYDLIIQNGTIFDGTGAAPFRGDIGIKGDRIAFVGKIDDETAAGCQIIDASGKTITPGFIDPHTHVDLSILTDPAMEPYLKQGVTTVVTGNCGYNMAPQGDEVFYWSMMDIDFLEQAGMDPNESFPLFFDKEKAAHAMKTKYHIQLDWKTFDDFNRKCDTLPLGCNTAPLIGYSALRTAVMGKDCLREATEEETIQLKQLTRECMEAGAFGLSTGRDPVYLPGPYASDAEMHLILQVVAEYGGIFTSHTYNCGPDGRPDRLGGYKEMIRQASGLDMKINISHVHVMHMADNGEAAIAAAKETLSLFKQLQKNGIDLSYDVLPSPACADFTQRSCGYYLKPLVLMSGSRKQLAKNFQDPLFRQMVHQMVKNGTMAYFNVDANSNWFGQLCILAHRDHTVIGKSILSLAKERDAHPLDALMDLFTDDPDMIADLTAPDFGEAVKLLCHSEMAMPCSDGSSNPKEANLLGHPEIPVFPNSMNIGYIPRYLTKYGSDDFAHAVHQASGFVAKRFDIKNRGILKAGNFADIVIMDRNALHSYDEDPDPLQDPEGIEYVFVNGQLACKDKTLTGNFSGRVLRKEKSPQRHI